MQVKSIFLFGLAVMILSCAPADRELHMSSSSEDGTLALSIWWIKTPPDGRITVSMIRQQRETEIQTPPGDWIPGVAEVFWSRDYTGVAFLICNDISSPLVSYYDLRSNKVVDATPTLTNLRLNLVRRYGLRNEDLVRFHGDPIKWACESMDARSQFQRTLTPKKLLPALGKRESPADQQKIFHIE